MSNRRLPGTGIGASSSSDQCSDQSSSSTRRRPSTTGNRSSFPRESSRRPTTAGVAGGGWKGDGGGGGVLGDGEGAAPGGKSFGGLGGMGGADEEASSHGRVVPRPSEAMGPIATPVASTSSMASIADESVGRKMTGLYLAPYRKGPSFFSSVTLMQGPIPEQTLGVVGQALPGSSPGICGRRLYVR